MGTTNTRQAAIERLGELITHIKVAMLTTVEGDGSLHSRPMVTQQIDFDGDLWFFTDAESAKCHEVEREGHVNVSYSDPSHQRFVAVSGRCQIRNDEAKKRELWNPVVAAFFPKGLKDETLRLLRVQVEHAEFWDAPSSRMVRLAGFARALVTGNRPELGEHGKVELTPGTQER